MPKKKFVRDSKFRHVFGEPFKKENCYDGIPITKNAWDGNYCAVNSKFVAAVLESRGGGAFIVLPLRKVHLIVSRSSQTSRVLSRFLSGLHLSTRI